MEIWWTKSKLPLSKAITWALDEDSSHVVFVFDRKFAVHSNLIGVNLAWASTVKKKCEIVHKMEFNLSLEHEEAIYRSLMDNFDHVPYDFKAFAYFAYRALLRKFFKIAIPVRSPFDGKGFLCLEIAKYIPWEKINPKLIALKHLDFSITSPSKLYKYMVKSLN